MALSELKRKTLNYCLGGIGTVLLIATLMMIWMTYNESFNNWVETRPDSHSVSKVQKRTRNKQDDYFFKIHYYYEVEGVENSFYHDPGYSSREEAEYQAQTFELAHNYTFWYEKENPSNVSDYKPNTSFIFLRLWLQFGVAALAIVIGVLYAINKKKLTFEEFMIKRDR